jgi:4'-phosphopantetheinyl transferase
MPASAAAGTRDALELVRCEFPAHGKLRIPEPLSRCVHVWLSLGVADPDACAESAKILSPDEISRAERFRFEGDRYAFVFARGMLRKVLGAYLEMEPQEVKFLYSEHGKPYVATPCSRAQVSFNLSHTDAAVLLAVWGGDEIGADIEKMRDDVEVDDVAKRFFSRQEQSELLSIGDRGLRRKAFFHCWARKESFLKAKGSGLALPLDEFDVDIDPAATAVKLVTRPDTTEAQLWCIINMPVGTEYAASVTIAKNSAGLWGF